MRICMKYRRLFNTFPLIAVYSIPACALPRAMPAETRLAGAGAIAGTNAAAWPPGARLTSLLIQRWGVRACGRRRRRRRNGEISKEEFAHWWFYAHHGCPLPPHHPAAQQDPASFWRGHRGSVVCVKNPPLSANIARRRKVWA